MIHLKKIFGILSCCWVSFFCLANDCNLPQSVKATIEEAQLSKLKSLRIHLKNCPSLKDSLAIVNHKLGSIYYNEFDNLDSAIFYTTQALKIRKSLFEDNPTVDLGKSNHNLGVFYNIKRKLKPAKIHLQAAIEIYKKLNPQRLIYSYAELARSYSLEGEYERAEEILHLVIAKAEEIKDETSIADAYLDLGYIALEKKEYAKSISIHQKAALIFKDFGWKEEVAYCENSIGAAQYQTQNYKAAIRSYKNAIAAIHAGNQLELSRQLNNLGLAYQKNNQPQLAFSTLQKALQIAKENQSKGIIAQCHDNLGEIYLGEKDLEKALFHFQKAIQTLLPNFSPTTYLQNPKHTDLEFAFLKIDLLIYLGDKAESLRLLAQTKKDSKYLRAALDLFQLGDKVIDQLRKEHQDTDTKLFWRKEAIPFYEAAIEVCHELQDVENGFFFFEKSRAILLLEGLQASDALDLIPDNRQAEIKKLQLQLQKIKEKMETALGIKKDSLLKTLVELQQDFEEKTKALVQDFPQYYEARFGTETISLEDFQKNFSTQKNKASVHFFYGEKNIYAITASANTAKLFRLGKTKLIETDLRKYLSFFEKSSKIENAPKDFLAQAEKIYSVLLRPLNIEAVQDLMIFPDGALAYLPFESLVVAPSNDLGTENYLIKNHLVSYGYSATIFSKQKNNLSDEQAGNTFTNEHLIVAFAPFAENNSNTKYAPLAFSNDELSEIRQTVGGLFLKNQEANKKNFLTRIQEYKVLHLSTHAFSSPSENKPHIVFADTSLYLPELYGLDIDADLVVLSACQSNIGKLSHGEGVMSLGRGFTYAGAKGLVSSLWNVNAVSTSRILSDFYKNLQNKTSKYESLHAAKIAYLENETLASYERSPYYWAGLVYYGNDQGLNLSEKNSNWRWAILGGILLLGFFFGRRFFLEKN